MKTRSPSGLVWREFTADDWMAYGGAEAWDDDEPIIAAIAVNGIEGEVVLDAQGAEIIVEGVTARLARGKDPGRAVAMLRAETTWEALKAQGWLVGEEA